MKIFLIRHGESTGDIEDRYGGDYDDSLTEKGFVQAGNLAEQLANEGIELLMHSPLEPVSKPHHNTPLAKDW